MFRKLLAALTAMLLLACALAEVPQEAEKPQEVEAEASREAEAADAAGTDASDDAEPKPAKGYVLVSTATQTGWLPLPEEGEYSYPLKQVLPDGTEAVNLIHLTPEGVYMEDSTCENHDCVEQGEVTLENRKDRILGNMIICLPNQVYLELYTPEEVLEMLQPEQADD